MKILLLDIETAPNLAHVWGLWDQNVGLPQLLESGYILSWAAKWYKKDEVLFCSAQTHNNKDLLVAIWHLLDEADAVIHYNGRRFDIPWLNGQFVKIGLLPPSPYSQIDLLETVKRTFKFPSNKLEYVVKALGVGEKFKNSGHELWIGCMNNDPNSWVEMEVYNRQDTVVLEKLYIKLLPWIKGHANHSLLSDGSKHLCPNCGGHDLQKRGFYNTLASTYQRFRCNTCGSWSKDNIVLDRKKYKTTSIQL